VGRADRRHEAFERFLELQNGLTFAHHGRRETGLGMGRRSEGGAVPGAHRVEETVDDGPGCGFLIGLGAHEARETEKRQYG
jgi:hypothetical protein